MSESTPTSRHGELRSRSDEQIENRDHQKPQDREPKPPFPEQKLKKPGLESELRPRPKYQARAYKAAGRRSTRWAGWTC